MAAEKDKDVEDTAVFLLALGEEEAAEVLRFMSPKEVQRLGMVMAAMKGVPKDRISEVLERFQADTEDHSGVGDASDEYLRSVLTKALGAEKAGFMLDRILQTGDTSGIESLKWMDAPSVAELIRNEHPQILASILVHLEADQAAAILNQFSERLKSDVVLRIATLEGIQPSALKELNDVLNKMLSGGEGLKRNRIGGVKAAAEILNYVGSSSEASIVESVREFDAELAQKILDEMFTFDNMMDIDDRGIQLVLREVQSESLVIALKGASPELRDKIFKNMSSRAAEMLREDLESKGPVKVSEVEAEQKEILKVVRRLSEEGQIALGGKGDDAFL